MAETPEKLQPPAVFSSNGAAMASLLLITAIWGSTFVVVKDTLNAMPWTLLVALRFTLAALTLAPVGLNRACLGSGIKLGLLLLVGFGGQTIGLMTTGAARAAFITGLSAVLVPWLSSRLLGVRIPRLVWWASILATVGLALLCFDPTTASAMNAPQLYEICLPGTHGPAWCWSMVQPNSGDVWVAICALAWSLYFLAIEEPAQRFAGTARGALQLTLVQVTTVALIAWVPASVHIDQLAQFNTKTWVAIVFLGTIATAATMLLQLLGQRIVDPSRAAIVYALEPLFATLFAWILLGERMGASGFIGGGLMIVATVLVQRRG